MFMPQGQDRVCSYHCNVNVFGMCFYLVDTRLTYAYCDFHFNPFIIVSNLLYSLTIASYIYMELIIIIRLTKFFNN